MLRAYNTRVKLNVRCFQMSLSRVILFAVVFASASLCLHAQPREKWKRVYTDEESVIDVNVSTLKLEANYLLRVDFRTKLSKPENIARDQGAKYKSRIETIRFKLNENRYRVCETTWFDSNGAKLQSSTSTGEDWRVVKQGAVMEKLSNAMRALSPFGSWKVIAYKFAEARPTAALESGLEKLVGIRVRFQAHQGQVGMKVCSSLSYEDERLSKDEFDRALGVRLETIGVNAEYAETTKLRCEMHGWNPPRSLLVKLKEDKMLMLWSGVFLILKKERDAL
jgi:hypothetical protein